MGEMNVILSLNDYSIYANDNYYLCVPNGNHNFYHVFMGFSMENLTWLMHEDLLMEIRKISDSIYAVYKNAVYVLPVIEPSLLEEVTKENDDRGYNQILKNIIQPITLSVYGKLVSQNKRVSQIIKMIKQNDTDKKLVGWLSMKLGNDFIKEITFENNVDTSEVYEDISNDMAEEVITIDYQFDDIWVKKEENKITETLKPAYSPGFSALKFLLMVLGIFLVLGAFIGYLIIK